MPALTASDQAVPYWVAVPAAGTGRRLGGATPKQYLVIAGRTVLEWSVAAFLEHEGLRGIVVAIAAEDQRFGELALAHRSEIASCTGGSERMESVCRALEALAAQGAREEDWVLVHDAVRPCLERSDLDVLCSALADDPVGGLLAIPLAETLKVVGADGRCERTLPREGLWRASTPQMFRLGLLRDALEHAHAAGIAATDEAMAVERLGFKPRPIAGRAGNLKITHASDVELAEAILLKRSRNGAA